MPERSCCWSGRREFAKRSRPEHPGTVRTLVNLGILHQETGDYAAARQRYERAGLLAETIAGPADIFTLHVLTGVAVVLSELGGDSRALHD